MRVEARSLSKRFGSLQALRDVTFEIPPGRRVALVGPNGSGKSTVNRVVMGLLAFEGDVRLDGVSPLEDRVAVARRMAYVPQIAPSLGAKVGELLSTFARVRGTSSQGVERVAARLGLDLASIASRSFRALSGGMRQKLLIAQALAADASLFILDEPTGSLDPRSREQFFALFAELAEQSTVLLCSHRLEEIRHLVDHVLVLEEGRLVGDAPAAEFLAASTTSRIELCVSEAAAVAWLRSQGFEAGAAGWWVRSVGQAEKLKLLEEVWQRLGGALRDVIVRDQDGLELGSRVEVDRLVEGGGRDAG